MGPQRGLPPCLLNSFEISINQWWSPAKRGLSSFKFYLYQMRSPAPPGLWKTKAVKKTKSQPPHYSLLSEVTKLLKDVPLSRRPACCSCHTQKWKRQLRKYLNCPAIPWFVNLFNYWRTSAIHRQAGAFLKESAKIENWKQRSNKLKRRWICQEWRPDPHVFTTGSETRPSCLLSSFIFYWNKMRSPVSAGLQKWKRRLR